MSIKVKDLHRQVRRKTLLEIYTVLTLVGIALAITTQYFTMEAQIYLPGLGGIAQGISFIATDFMTHLDPLHVKQVQILIYWILYIMMNIPVFMLMYKWYGSQFFNRTVYVFVINFGVTMLLANIPAFATAQAIPVVPGIEDSITGGVEYLAALEALRIMMLGILGAMLYGTSVGLAFKYGGCTAGLDPIAKYLSREKGINLTQVLFAIGIAISFTFIFIRFFTSGMHEDDNLITGVFLSPEMISTLLFLVTYSAIAAMIYSATKKLRVQVNSEKVEEMSEFFNKSNFHRSHTIVKVIGGYSKKEYDQLVMVINIEELNDITEDIASIDPKCMITVMEISRVYDLHDWTPETKYDKQLKQKKTNKK